jgi:hypothetical protein
VLNVPFFVRVLVEVVVVVVGSSVIVAPTIDVKVVGTGLAGPTAGYDSIKLDIHSVTYTHGMKSILIGIGH